MILFAAGEIPPADMRIIEVREYDPTWPDRFRKEASVLREILGPNAVDIEHIGSTSVPGMTAKPTIDILVSVKDLAALDSSGNKFPDRGYSILGENGIPGRRFFVKQKFINGQDWVNEFHVHIFEQKDSFNLLRHRAVRDYLIANPSRATEYGRVKFETFVKIKGNPKLYYNEKEDFVTGLEREALKWVKDKGSE